MRGDSQGTEKTANHAHHQKFQKSEVDAYTEHFSFHNLASQSLSTYNSLFLFLSLEGSLKSHQSFDLPERSQACETSAKMVQFGEKVSILRNMPHNGSRGQHMV